MPKAITVSLLNSIKPKDKAFDVRDSKLPGFLVRVQPTGLLTFYVEYDRGKRKRIGKATILSPEGARREAREIIRKYELGLELSDQKEQTPEITLGSFVEDHYKAHAHLSLSIPHQTIRRLELNFSHLFAKKMNDLDVRHIEEWRSKKLTGGAKISTINRALTDLKSVFSRAKSLGFIQENRIANVKAKQETERENRFLTDGEEFRLLIALKQRDSSKINRSQTIDDRMHFDIATGEGSVTMMPTDHFTPAVLLSLHTGLRCGELTKLEWKDVRQDDSGVYLSIRAENSKNRRQRIVPLNETALQIIEVWKSHPMAGKSYVFEQEGGRPFFAFQSTFKRVLRKAEIENFRWHDLRHTFASRLVSKGKDLYRVQQLLGHSSPKMTMRYAHLSREDLVEAVRQLDNS